MHQDDSRIALEHCIVVLPEAARRIAGREQLARLDKQNLRFGADLVEADRGVNETITRAYDGRYSAFSTAML